MGSESTEYNVTRCIQAVVCILRRTLFRPKNSATNSSLPRLKGTRIPDVKITLNLILQVLEYSQANLR
jgi:hypothetical protein